MIELMHPIYLDNNATTPVDPSVSAVMAPLLEQTYGNPHSEHIFGWQAAERIDRAQEQVASLIGANPDEIIFTSGATEANNHAIQGILRNANRRKVHVVTTTIEHKSILQTLAAMESETVEVEILPVGPGGRVDPELLTKSLKDETVLVSIGMANNEIGTIQPIRDLASRCRDHGITIHTDAAQAVGKIPVDVSKNCIDLLSLSGHKIYGPKGIGALYISRHAPIQPAPLLYGGAQQNGLRAGTTPTILCAGLGEACRIAKQRMPTDADHAIRLRSLLLKELRHAIPNLEINGSMHYRLPGNLNITIPGFDMDALLASLQGKLAASTGSACNAGLIESSYVLRALGVSTEAIAASFRMGIGRFTTTEDILAAAELIVGKVSPAQPIAVNA